MPPHAPTPQLHAVLKGGDAHAHAWLTSAFRALLLNPLSLATYAEPGHAAADALLEAWCWLMFGVRRGKLPEPYTGGAPSVRRAWNLVALLSGESGVKRIAQQTAHLAVHPESETIAARYLWLRALLPKFGVRGAVDQVVPHSDFVRWGAVLKEQKEVLGKCGVRDRGSHDSKDAQPAQTVLAMLRDHFGLDSVRVQLRRGGQDASTYRLFVPGLAALPPDMGLCTA